MDVSLPLLGKSHLGASHAMMHVERLSKWARLLQTEGDYDPISSGWIFYLEQHAPHAGLTARRGLGGTALGANARLRGASAPFARCGPGPRVCEAGGGGGAGRGLAAGK